MTDLLSSERRQSGVRAGRPPGGDMAVLRSPPREVLEPGGWDLGAGADSAAATLERYWQELEYADVGLRLTDWATRASLLVLSMMVFLAILSHP